MLTARYHGGVLSIVGIVICGLIGGVCAWMLVTSIGLAGVPGALAAAVIAMAIAVAAWVAATTVWRLLAGRR
jgi:hypothetical protein